MVAGLATLHLPEQGHDVLGRPADVAHGSPTVVVGTGAAHIVHAIDTTAATHDASAPPMVGLHIASGVGLGPVAPLEAREVKIIAEAERFHEPHIRGAGLKDEYAPRGVLAEASSHDAARASRSDDDVVPQV